MRALLARRGTRNRRGQGTTARRHGWSPPRRKAPRSTTVCRWRGSPNCTWCTANRRKKERGWSESTRTEPTVHQPLPWTANGYAPRQRPTSWLAGLSPAPSRSPGAPSAAGRLPPAGRPGPSRQPATVSPPWPLNWAEMRPKPQNQVPEFFFFSFPRLKLA